MDKKEVERSLLGTFFSSYVNHRMWLIIVSLIPVMLSVLMYLGNRAFLLLIMGMGSGIVTQVLLNLLSHRFVLRQLGASIAISLILALLLPPTAPLWFPVFGSVIALLAMSVFGGAKQIPFHPSLIARNFLHFSFPALFTYLQGRSLEAAVYGSGTHSAIAWSNAAGVLGDSSATAVVIGGIMLVAFRIIDWRIPSLTVASAMLLSLILGQSPVTHLLNGALLFGAFYCATLFETVPRSRKGILFYGICSGLLVIIMRQFNPMEGSYYAFLLMNFLSPLMDHG